MLNEHSIRKYAANSKHVDHVEWRQRFYLLLLYKNKAVCLGVSEFAAYFRQALSEVRGKTEIVRPDPSFRLPRPAVLLAKIGLCSEVFDFPRTFEIRGPAKRVLATLAASAPTSSCRRNIKGPLPENRTTTLLGHRLTQSARKPYH